MELERCPECGAPVPPLKTCALDTCAVKFRRGEGGRPDALYCSEKHRNTAAMQRRRQRQQGLPKAARKCELDGCEVTFRPGENGRPDAVYCTPQHQKLAKDGRRRQRKLDPDPDAYRADRAAYMREYRQRKKEKAGQ